MHPDEFEATEVGDESTPPSWFTGSHLSPEASRMGLTQHVPEGALLDFAGSLDGAKTMHRVAAWFMLAVFCLPVVFALMRIWYAVF